MYFITTDSSAAPQIPLCWRILESNPELFRLWLWQSDALPNRLDLIHYTFFLQKEVDVGEVDNTLFFKLIFPVLYGF
jgi:hypothetical protein